MQIADPVLASASYNQPPRSYLTDDPRPSAGLIGDVLQQNSLTAGNLNRVLHVLTELHQRVFGPVPPMPKAQVAGAPLPGSPDQALALTGSARGLTDIADELSHVADNLTARL